MDSSQLINFIVFIQVLSIKPDYCVPNYSESEQCDCVIRENCANANELEMLNSVKCEDENLVCCPATIENKISLAEKKCLEYTKIPGFCPDVPFIMNGKETKPNEFPFMVAIKQKKPHETADWICGGSLISSLFVLTAAHCFDDYYKNNTKNEISVLLGAHKRLESGIEFNVSIIIHPDYDDYTNYADIALLKLENSANISAMKPACLPRTNGSNLTDFTVAGWGLNGTKPPDVLLKGTTVQTKPETCNNDQPIQPDEPDQFQTESQICAIPKNNLGETCSGDSGGPLFTSYKNHDNCLSEIFGVTSSGMICSLAGSHTIYTRVSFFREWIEEKVWPGEALETMV